MLDLDSYKLNDHWASSANLADNDMLIDCIMTRDLVQQPEETPMIKGQQACNVLQDNRQHHNNPHQHPIVFQRQLSQLNNRRRQESPASNIASYVSSRILTGADSIVTMKSTMLKSSSINMV